jgi:hypothetical protein
MAEKTTPNPTPGASNGKTESKSSDRLEKFFDQIAEIDAKNRQAAYEAIEEYTKLMKASIDYAGRLNEEWRRIALETSRRAADVMTAWV